jgi:hypothetical protein
MDADESKSPSRRTGSDAHTRPAPWYRRVAFWRAVAGMALALALASLAVMVETTSDLSSRSAIFHRRLTQMSARIARMRIRLENEDRELLAMRRETAARDTLNAILSQPDAAVIRLEAASKDSTATGLVVVSGKTRRAVLEVAGLPPLGAARCYVLWWTPQKGNPAKAAQFPIGNDGRASVQAQPPPGDDAVAIAFVTAEPDPAPAAPSGAIELKSATKGVSLLFLR